jgi:NADP-dependent 3-hydroxy acid dehydrogenase YdfG
MKMLVTGGNRGLGQAICNRFDATSVSREVGFDITKNVTQIAALSEKHDVFVNNAFDGPFHESWANFAQTKVLFAVAKAWKELGKQGHIINIGSVGTERVSAPEPEFETYRISKASLKAHSLQWTESFKAGQISFKTTLLTIDRLDTPLSRSRSNWTGNGLNLDNICDYIELITKSPKNTCIGEIVMWCQF